ncbi:MAG: NYN domain-containing protein [Acidobacteriota bacterium]|nr:NYN domain-containing protein [Acidobacteriota bacterium]
MNNSSMLTLTKNMKHYTYVDNSNVFLEGQRVSAVFKGMAPNIYEAMNRDIKDFSWQPDYGRLHEFLCGTNDCEIGGARLWGSPPPSDSFWRMVERKGFKVTTYEKSFAGKEKKVDVAIAHQITKDAYTVIDKTNDEINLVAGDKDFVPVVEDLVAEGFTVIVVFWNHAAPELKSVATSFIGLDAHLALLSR